MNRYVLTAIVLIATPCQAEVRLPKLIGSHMVLQRDSEVMIWGWADPGEEVQLDFSWLHSPANTVADAEGNWLVSVKTKQAGGPHAITITGENKIRLDQVLFGEVWLASGQSNMEMPLAPVSGAYTGIKDYRKEIAEARYPEIRLFQVGNFSSEKPLDDVEPGISMYGIPESACRCRACTPVVLQAKWHSH